MLTDIHQDDINIDRNLKILCESKDTMKFEVTNFTNEKGVKMYSDFESKAFANLMKNKGLIRIHGDYCSLECFGYDVFNSGGWLRYLSDKNKKETELESLELELKKLQKEKLEYEVTIRSQNDRIRNLQEQIKIINLIKSYWFLIPICITIVIVLVKVAALIIQLM